MKKYSILIVLLLCLHAGWTQDRINVPNLVPPSPNAASLGKYGEIPVSLYTGIPEISVPLFTAKSGLLALPVNLSYHSGGIKVQEVASNVGLGWSLKAGGCITRTVMGIDDCEPEIGYMNQTSLDWYLQNPYSSESMSVLVKIGARYYDGEPDVYNFSFGNWSGTFVYYQEKQEFISTPFSKLKIKAFIQSNEIEHFEITDPDGILYSFAAVERTESVMSVRGEGQVRSVPTSWYLTEVRDLKNNTSIALNYSYYQYYLTNWAYEVKKDRIASPVYQTISGNSGFGIKDSTRMSGVRLSTINFKGGRIDFTYDTQERCDLPGDYALKKITVYNDFKLLYRYDLIQSFFYEDPNNTTCSNESKYTQRLKLDEVRTVDVNNTATYVAHKFGYYGNNVFPSRLSFQQDEFGFWGDNVGVYNTLIPQVNYDGATYPGAIKKVNQEKTRFGLLNEIVYPTGGKTLFEYENNTSVFSQTILNQEAVGVFENAHVEYKENCSVWGDGYKMSDKVEGELTLEKADYVYFDFSGYDKRNYQETYGIPAPDYTPYLYNVNNPSQDIYAHTGYETVTQYSRNNKIFLPAGTYKVGVLFPVGQECPTDPKVLDLYRELSFSAYYIRPLPPSSIWYNMPTGGARISQIKSYTDNDPATKPIITQYNYNNAAGRSTGTSQYNTAYSLPCAYVTNGGMMSESNLVIYLKRYALSHYPLIYTQGSIIGYSQVTEEKVNTNGDVLGKTENYFTSLADYDDFYETDYPFTPVIKKDWKRGLPIKKKIYKTGSDGNAQLISAEENTYAPMEDLFYDEGSVGARVGFTVMSGSTDYAFEGQEISDPGTIMSSGFIQRKINQYHIKSGIMQLYKKVESFYDANDATGKLERTTDYAYNVNNLKPEEITTKNSKKEEVKTKFYYPDELEQLNSPKYTAFSELNLLSPLLRTETYNGDTKLQTSAVSYEKQGSVFLPKTYTEQIKEASVRELLTVNNYDTHGNILETKDKTGMVNSFIVDYSTEDYVALVKNASSNNIAYSSFESNTWGNWTPSGNVISTASFTGKKAFNGTLTKAVAPGNYVVMLWTNASATVNGNSGVTIATSGAWKLQKYEIGGGSSVQVQSTCMDEVRLYPKDAQMTTYTYEPLVGMTSATDPSGKTVFYEYDGFQRLKLIRDQEGKIVKQFDYTYQGQ